jgi:hypothetical protein
MIFSRNKNTPSELITVRNSQESIILNYLIENQFYEYAAKINTNNETKYTIWKEFLIVVHVDRIFIAKNIRKHFDFLSNTKFLCLI